MPRYIDTQQKFEELIRELKGSSVLCIDTEFMREKTYYAKLCLVQINNGSIQALIDAIQIEDLTPLAQLLTDENIVKVFHAGSQDIEVLYYATGVVPKNVFDTQIAAAVLGYQLQIGYGPLVLSVCNVSLPKAHGYTDWARRPLTGAQQKYAIDDVTYLLDVYRELESKLEKKGRASWLKADFEHLCNTSRFISDPRNMFEHVKHIGSLNRRQLAIAREVSAWRELEAQRLNKPRRWVLPDEAVIEISRKAPNSREALMEIRGLEGHLNKKQVKRILDCVVLGKKIPECELPRIKNKNRKGEPKVDAVINMMAALVDLRARENNVAPQALASRDELAKLAHGHKNESTLLQGWRKEMIGSELCKLLDGNIALKVCDGDICAVKN